ncbi:MAG: rhomboid family intramembrane serine protease [Candidatus Promineifilaceae bacterium]|nr:rhomboid family intramembrane serine protease [Candidatus Promineifilaceae bacterium]
MLPERDEQQELRDHFDRAATRLRLHVQLLVVLVGAAWMIEAVDVLFLRQALNNFGIRPRETASLAGIFLMPLLHGGFGHLIANTLPFIVLGWLVMLRRVGEFAAVTVITLLFSGVGLWLFGISGAVYIGASGLVFGYLGYLLLRAYFERSAQAIFIAVIVAFAYGGLLLGLFPQRPGVSWEAHLLGFFGGILAARLLAT